MNLDISFLGQKYRNFLKQKARGHKDSLHFVVYPLYQEITACAKAKPYYARPYYLKNAPK